MAIQCEKTGAVVYLADYGAVIRGDAFRAGTAMIFHVNNGSMEYAPSHRSTVHYTACDALRFDENQPFGTIITQDFIYHGYEGRLLREVI